MPLYRVIRKSDQKQAYAYSADAPIEWVGLEFATHDHVELVELVDPPPPPPPPVDARITKLAFINRFTDAEWVAFDLTAIDNPSGSPTERQQKSAMRLFMKKVDLATFIDLGDPRTRGGVQALEAMGLLGAGRALEILDTPPTENEVWNG